MITVKINSVIPHVFRVSWSGCKVHVENLERLTSKKYNLAPIEQARCYERKAVPEDKYLEKRYWAKEGYIISEDGALLRVSKHPVIRDAKISVAAEKVTQEWYEREIQKAFITTTALGELAIAVNLIHEQVVKGKLASIKAKSGILDIPVKCWPDDIEISIWFEEGKKNE